MPLLITHQQNIRYLIGFTGSSGFLLMTKKQNYFFTDFRYRGIAEALEKKKTRLPFKFIEMDGDLEKQIKKILGRAKKLEFEAQHMRVAHLQHWKKRLKGVKFSALKNPIEKQRLIKDKAEIRLLKKSQIINEQTLERVKKHFKKGVTELELAWQIKAIGHELGAEDISFEPIVAFGAHSAVPHHQNTTRKMKKGDVVLIDMGMKYKGYCSDMTRTFFTAKPTALQTEVYELTLKAQEIGIQTAKAGVKCATVDKKARAVLGDYDQYFKHSLGHGIGLDVHEDPGLSGRSKATLKEGMVVTMEPGIYLEGKFGVRIEDMGRITHKGYDNFTGAAKSIKSAIVPVRGA